ncbi:MAG: DUF1318 domain-containing protein [Magnetococcales bacterium]|nr:DUF1318 domain-containing protein [Magnetococcales bacterium]MBF0157529.1 DUF1318 domain-containing protein [Magnetococcales bacterium]
MAGACFLALPAWGEDLAPQEVVTFRSAKAAGMLREGENGYLEPGPGLDAGGRSLMERVNALRRERYVELSRREGVPLEAVEGAAAARLRRP